jgi:hypothetical protein
VLPRLPAPVKPSLKLACPQHATSTSVQFHPVQFTNTSYSVLNRR